MPLKPINGNKVVITYFITSFKQVQAKLSRMTIGSRNLLGCVPPTFSLYSGNVASGLDREGLEMDFVKHFILCTIGNQCCLLMVYLNRIEDHSLRFLRVEPSYSDSCSPLLYLNNYTYIKGRYFRPTRKPSQPLSPAAPAAEKKY